MASLLNFNECDTESEYFPKTDGSDIGSDMDTYVCDEVSEKRNEDKLTIHLWFCLGASDGCVLVRRRPGDCLQPNCLSPRHIVPTPGVIIFEAILYNSLGVPVIILITLTTIVLRQPGNSTHCTAIHEQHSRGSFSTGYILPSHDCCNAMRYIECWHVTLDYEITKLVSNLACVGYHLMTTQASPAKTNHTKFDTTIQVHNMELHTTKKHMASL
ncbi:hypothetical protein TNCV_2789651 [Trichonephila clavipes]|nr:hypothetical protein TNCV_2789651 [Trichonephila clavipes]